MYTRTVPTWRAMEGVSNQQVAVCRALFVGRKIFGVTSIPLNQPRWLDAVIPICAMCVVARFLLMLAILRGLP
jgi:hypothetical protein